MMRRRLCLKAALASAAALASGCTLGDMAPRANQAGAAKAQALAALRLANDYWQRGHRPSERAFWDVAAYHSGNMEAYFLTGDETYRAYSSAWAEHNGWSSAGSNVKADWKYHYGETPDHVLFGDWQICFQTYLDLYLLEPQKDPRKAARAFEVMGYQIGTPNQDYWWWVDGLYMVMPVMTKLYKASGDTRYLDKLQEYFVFADQLMFDADSALYYRDAKYLYPRHRSANGGKDFWARGNGWAFAAFAKVLADLPASHPAHPLFVDRFTRMARALKAAQQGEGYWSRSILDPRHAPGPESSGTAFFTYGYLWGMNHGYLDPAEYAGTANQAWRFLSRVALQPSGKLGYVQPIGERAIPGQVVDKDSSAPFGVGAFLLAGAEMVRFASQHHV